MNTRVEPNAVGSAGALLFKDSHGRAGLTAALHVKVTAQFTRVDGEMKAISSMIISLAPIRYFYGGRAASK